LISWLWKIFSWKRWFTIMSIFKGWRFITGLSQGFTMNPVCSAGWSQTLDPLIKVSQVLGWQVCTTWMYGAQHIHTFKVMFIIFLVFCTWWILWPNKRPRQIIEMIDTELWWVSFFKYTFWWIIFNTEKISSWKHFCQEL
jgi:hypothetical protein